MQQGEQIDVLMDCDAVSARKAIDVDYFRQKVLRRGGAVLFGGAGEVSFAISLSQNHAEY